MPVITKVEYVKIVASSPSTFETSFLSTSTTNRKVAAKITNVTTSTSQTLALSSAGNSYTLSSLSASVGDTIVITFYYTDGEPGSDNRVRVKQHGGSSATATIGGIILGGSITSVQNQALSGNPTLSGFPNPSTNNTFSISTSTQAISSTLHEVLEINSADPGDRYQVGFSFTVPTGITKIEIDNDDDESEAQYITNLNFPIAVGAGITAPTASSVTFNNPASPNTTATVNLSAPGSEGTLQYACEINDTTPDNWQSSNQFTISRGSSGTVYARARRSTTAVSNTVSASRPGFLTGDTAVSPADVIIDPTASSATVNVSNVTSGETYAVRAVNGSTNFATATASSTGVSIGTFSNNLPSAGNSTTYEIFVRRPTSTGGDGSTFVDTNDQFTVTRQTSGSGGGGGGGSVGSVDYGISVFNSSGQEIWGVNERSTNTVKSGSLTVPASTISSGGSAGTVTVTGVEDITPSNSDIIEVYFVGGDAQRITLSRGTGQFTATNFYGVAYTVGYVVVRYG